MPEVPYALRSAERHRGERQLRRSHDRAQASATWGLSETTRDVIRLPTSSCGCASSSGRQFLENLVGYFEIGKDVLNVVIVIEHRDQL